MKYVVTILILLFSSCIIIPLPAHRTEGRVFIKPEMIQFIHIDSTLREEVLLKLGDPDGVALRQQVFIYQWTVSKGIAGIGGAYSAAVADITQKQFFLVSFNPNHTVHKMEIFNHNIDKSKKNLYQFVVEWNDMAFKKNN
ncbi:MAG TPA: hypothetical protein VIL78_03865 [Hanamia sp.]